MILHDLTHYVVETQLEIQDGFYGLLDQGLDITDFEKKVKITSSSIPADGIRAEILVGMLLTELNDARPFSDFNEACEEIMNRYYLSHTRLPEASLTALRNGRDEVIKKWNNLPVGSTFVLDFPPS